MSYVVLTSLASFIVLCVCPKINYSEKNKFVFYKPSVHLDHRYHKQFKLHSNWPELCQPLIPRSLDWEHHYLPSPCLIFGT